MQRLRRTFQSEDKVCTYTSIAFKPNKVIVLILLSVKHDITQSHTFLRSEFKIKKVTPRGRVHLAV